MDAYFGTPYLILYPIYVKFISYFTANMVLYFIKIICVSDFQIDSKSEKNENNPDVVVYSNFG
ncbi:MAG: hypothetical protein PSX81_05790 [bacterium]|nr:hypothetical protein [bacterium]